MGLTYVVPDIHGRFDLLTVALAEIDKRPKGTLIFLGDYIDRGPDSARVVREIMSRPDAIALKGNHELYAIDASLHPFWMISGGDQTLASFGGEIPEDVLKWFAGLPLVHEDKHRVYVHAAVSDQYDLSDMPDSLALWFRYSDDDHGGYRGKHVVHGHTPTGRVERYEGRTNLDAGAVFIGKLCVGVFDDETPGGPIEIIEAT